jgi:hypothetical protein
VKTSLGEQLLAAKEKRQEREMSRQGDQEKISERGCVKIPFDLNRKKIS